MEDDRKNTSFYDILRVANSGHTTLVLDEVAADYELKQLYGFGLHETISIARVAMSRNVVSDETAERNRTGGIPGGYTFNTFPPGDYEGVGFTFGVIRLGDHAHIEVESGRVVAGPDGDDFYQRLRMGRAGKLVLRWHEWELLREILEPHENVRIAEIEKPTQSMARRYA